MKQIIVVAAALALTACATAPKQVAKQPNRTEKIIAQQNAEKTKYQNIYNDTLAINGKPVQFIGRIEVKDGLTEKELVIVKRGDTAKVTALKTAQFFASIFVPAAPTTVFTKDELKGVVLEPKHPNKSFDYAKPLMMQWVTANATKFAPNAKPIDKIIVEPRRFYLVYENLVGKEMYYLTNELNVLLYNSKLTDEAYHHQCKKTSAVSDLEEWQANNYAKVDETLHAHIKACVADLTEKQQGIYDYLAQNPEPTL